MAASHTYGRSKAAARKGKGARLSRCRHNRSAVRGSSAPRGPSVVNQPYHGFRGLRQASRTSRQVATQDGNAHDVRA
jgi:hypothetical protein